MLESFFKDPTKLPTVPAAVAPGEGDFRFPFAVLMLLCGAGGMVAALIAAILGALSVAAWCLVLGLAAIIVGQLVIPRA